MTSWKKIPFNDQWANELDVNASGYVIKCYQAGTPTPIAMAIDSAGATTIATATLNANGVPEVSGNEVALYIDQNFKYAIYENATDASNDTNPFYGPIDNVKVDSDSDIADIVGKVANYSFDTVSDMKSGLTVGGETITPVLGYKLSTAGYYSSGDGGHGDYIVTNDTANDIDKLDLGGGLTASLQTDSGPAIVEQYGIKDDGVDYTSNFDALIANSPAAIVINKTYVCANIEISHKIQVSGAGTLKRPEDNNSDYIVRLSGEGSEWTGVNFDGNKANQSAPSGRQANLHVNAARCQVSNIDTDNCAEIVHGNGIELTGSATDCFVKNVSSDSCDIGVRDRGSRNTFIKLRVTEFTRKGFLLDAPSEWTVLDGLEASSSATPVASGGEGLLVDPDVSGNAGTFIARNIKITGMGNFTSPNLVKAAFVDSFRMYDFELDHTATLASTMRIQGSVGELILENGKIAQFFNQDWGDYSPSLIRMQNVEFGAGSAPSVGTPIQQILADRIELISVTSSNNTGDMISLDNWPTRSGAAEPVVVIRGGSLDAASGSNVLSIPYGSSDFSVGNYEVSGFDVITGSGSMSASNTLNQRIMVQPKPVASFRTFINNGPPTSTSYPADGFYLRGDRVIDPSPTSGSPDYWRCTADGSTSSSGTWVAGASLT